MGLYFILVILPYPFWVVIFAYHHSFTANLRTKGENARLTILGATSGDTGTIHTREERCGHHLLAGISLLCTS